MLYEIQRLNGTRSFLSFNGKKDQGDLRSLFFCLMEGRIKDTFAMQNNKANQKVDTCRTLPSGMSPWEHCSHATWSCWSVPLLCLTLISCEEQLMLYMSKQHCAKSLYSFMWRKCKFEEAIAILSCYPNRSNQIKSNQELSTFESR